MRVPASRMFFLCALLVAASAATSEAALVLNDLSDQTEDFDFLSAGPLGAVWVDDNSVRSAYGSPGWYWQQIGGNEDPYFISAGGSGTGRSYSYGFATGTTDRAMGSLNQDASATEVARGVVYENQTGVEIKSITVTYTGEQWRASGTSTDRMAFSFKVDDAEIIDYQAGAGAAPAGWTAVGDLDFYSPDGSNAGAINGNAADNRVTLTYTFDVNLAAGDFLALRWTDLNASGVDDGLAIDDLRVSFVAAIPEPSVVLTLGLVSAWMTVVHGRRRSTEA